MISKTHIELVSYDVFCFLKLQNHINLLLRKLLFAALGFWQIWLNELCPLENIAKKILSQKLHGPGLQFFKSVFLSNKHVSFDICFQLLFWVSIHRLKIKNHPVGKRLLGSNNLSALCINSKLESSNPYYVSDWNHLGHNFLLLVFAVKIQMGHRLHKIIGSKTRFGSVKGLVYDLHFHLQASLVWDVGLGKIKHDGKQRDFVDLSPYFFGRFVAVDFFLGQYNYVLLFVTLQNISLVTLLVSSRCHTLFGYHLFKTYLSLIL